MGGGSVDKKTTDGKGEAPLDFCEKEFNRKENGRDLGCDPQLTPQKPPQPARDSIGA